LIVAHFRYDCSVIVLKMMELWNGEFFFMAIACLITTTFHACGNWTTISFLI